jgi:type IV pilus assembly protein PilW
MDLPGIKKMESRVVGIAYFYIRNGDMNKKGKRPENGFTLIELMVAMAITLVVLSAIFMTFKSQQDSYVVQDQVTRMQQNLRGAMYVMTRDIQMAGYYTNFDSGTCTTDWDDDGNDETVRPLLYGRDNVMSATVNGKDVKDNTDIIVIIKGSQDFNRVLTAGEGTTPGSTEITLLDRDLDGNEDNDPDLDNNYNKYGLLVKKDLTKADIFEVNNASGDITPVDPAPLNENYDESDFIFRADVIIYWIDIETDPAHPTLNRTNLSSTSGSTKVAEDIDSLQVRYRLSDGSLVAASGTINWASVRAVEVSLLARTGRTIRGYTDPNTYSLGGYSISTGDNFRRKVLTTVIETRNIGL